MFYLFSSKTCAHTLPHTLSSIGPDQTPEGDFDFESNLAEFSKVNLSEDNNDSDGEEDDEINEQENNSGAGTCVYTKDDFFDSISCDVLDKQNGIDNRLRGAAERSLNTETFGAVSLGTGRRGGRRNRRGRGGGRGGRGRGFGRGGLMVQDQKKIIVGKDKETIEEEATTTMYPDGLMVMED